MNICYIRGIVWGAVVIRTAAEIKPIEPETDNAGVGKNMKNYQTYTKSRVFNTGVPEKKGEKFSRKEFRYVSGKHYFSSNHQ